MVVGFRIFGSQTIRLNINKPPAYGPLISVEFLIVIFDNCNYLLQKTIILLHKLLNFINIFRNNNKEVVFFIDTVKLVIAKCIDINLLYSFATNRLHLYKKKTITVNRNTKNKVTKTDYLIRKLSSLSNCRSLLNGKTHR